MTAEGRTPGLRTWNLLLLAYARNGDLAGVSRVFDRLVQQPSLKPDAYSFASILDLMSQRGDVDGVKNMFALAADIDQGIIRSTAVTGYLVTAFINNDDLEAAEMVAEQLRKRKDSETMSGSLTPIWNSLATAYALRRDVTSTRRIYEKMQAEGIAPDELTYAALLQVLCLVRDTDAAYKILRLVIPRRPVRQLAFHYAIIMAGYINQRDFEKVWHVDAHRRANGVRASLSTRIAVIKAAAMSEYVGRYSNREDPNSDLVRTEKVLAATLARNDPLEMSVEPQTGLGIRTMDQTDGAYVEFVMLIYGNKYAFDMVERLFQEYVARHQNDVSLTDPDKGPPLRMLVALMNAHFSAGRYDDVEQLWKLAVGTGARLAKLSTPTAAAHPDNTDHPGHLIAPARAHLLSQPFVIYLRTLHFQGRYADAQRTVSDLIGQGYTLDNLSWNLYIQLLARTGRISLAFSLCEKHLMPQWRGWRKASQHLKRSYKNSRGWDYMNINANLSKPNIVMPQYRTMVILAAAMKYVRRLEAVGRARRSHSDNDDGVPLSEAQLRFNAPRTVTALQAMPYVDDDLQAMFLRDD
ncbi:hypothetical protein GTA08_BOTSDO10183 [Neofusicoccum parvum]|nr:hypothetical protein GTA08_BOTSDO10183 [Neofusicoccum parvum]